MKYNANLIKSSFENETPTLQVSNEELLEGSFDSAYPLINTDMIACCYGKINQVPVCVYHDENGRLKEGDLHGVAINFDSGLVSFCGNVLIVDEEEDQSSPFDLDAIDSLISSGKICAYLMSAK